MTMFTYSFTTTHQSNEVAWITYELFPTISGVMNETSHLLSGILITEEPPMPISGSQQSMFSQPDSPARITRLQETALDWLETVALSGGTHMGSLLASVPSGLSERMFLASSLPEVDEISSPSLIHLFNSGMASPGLYWTASTSEWRNDAAVCSLSDILVDDPDPKYSLSPKACSGILRRADKRNRRLPKPLLKALKMVADS